MPLSDNLRGALFMVVAMAAFTINDMFMKLITQDIPLFQAITLRGTLTVAALALLVLTTAKGRFAVPRSDTPTVALRAVAEAVATFTFIAALMHMPLGNLSAILQSLPLLVTLTAALVFGDRIGWRRMTAIAIGFVGVLIIIRPGTSGFDVWSLVGLASVATVVVRDLSTRRLSPGIPSVTVAFWTSILLTASSALLSLTETWVAPQTSTLLMIPAATIGVVLGYLTIIRAMRVGDIGFVAPYRYTALLWAVALGWLAFGDFPDGWTLFGSAIVVATGIFTIWRERKVRAGA
ncbi:MAG: DMT family transporter [Paracoccaceae bacterium]